MRIWQAIFAIFEAFDLDDNKGHVDLSKLAGLSLIIICFIDAFSDNVRITATQITGISLGASLVIGRHMYKIWLMNTKQTIEAKHEIREVKEEFERDEKDDYTDWGDV